MELKKYKLGEIADVIGGVNFEPTEIETSGIRILRGGNIQNHSINFKDDDVFLPAQYENATNQIQVGDTIVVASTGSVEVLGKAATCFKAIPKTQIGAFLRLIRPKKPQFAMLISIAVNSEHFKKYIRAQAKGTSINNINLGHLNNYEFEAPAQSQNMSSFYYNIETKIALNRAINQNLEAMAKQLYDYWFVQFDFPNEKGKPYKSSGGKMIWSDTLKREIPIGWDVLNFESLFEIGNGKTIPDSEGLIPAYGGNGIVKYIGESNYDACFVIGRVGANCGSVHYSPIPCWVSDNAIAIKPQNIQNSPYLLNTLKLYDLSQGKGGSSQPLITHAGLKRLLFPFMESVVRQYCDIANLQLSMYYENQSEISTLTKQRDELLPLLMNGQVSVKQLNSDLSAH